ncbi:hypothetical protein E3Q22_01192 [Wallemia mellicola]|uniref:Uncharacterized protein n=2 Tax=Wallemia mellicola TaxID=1708541 RepID=A0A4T0TLS2_9BASI|nr:hypothetical protein WALSEDRAFT_64626 [Wallemia mellicola CBS 633.66]TIB70596.1 hypothetical protein E3Q24_02851 [Wallemia mellicola]EIM21364.1 hypothetical protein WALSEDRAFT_64626 [Wallemia mellicola CBS 633.66]TIB81372.1 hypothetical protein E3Q22_01192 [Wallemia mellicola]TIB88672.1 hypothetical protein E3Q21_00907 [Wallemia mellicola]TIB91341.1 hypothetical protein E3Q20_00893 [Wallemia mellicola]|eukprot:XP_006958711.1 hypothetical protein WALSEDRAFT_64626 [Wallemia mellicola CBS 633.66]
MSNQDSEEGIDLDSMSYTIHDIQDDSRTDELSSPQLTACSSTSNSPPTSLRSSKSINVQRKSISSAHGQPTVKTPPSTWFKPKMKRIKINDDNSDKRKPDSKLVSFVKGAFTAFGNAEKADYSSFFSPELKATINALPYTVDGLKDVYNFITGSWSSVQVEFKYVIEHPRLMGKWGEGEVGAVAELVGNDYFGNKQLVKCLFTMVVIVNDEHKQQIKDWSEVMSVES